MPRKTHSPHDIDYCIGQNIKILRAKFGMTQKDLAKLLGISFQQVQKYETADNRISASQLYNIAQTLGISVGEMYNEYNGKQIHNPEMLRMIHDIYTLSDTDRALIRKIITRLNK